MKTKMMMKGLMLAAMMSVTTAMMATTASKGTVKNDKFHSSTALTSQRGHETAVVNVATYGAPVAAVVVPGRGHGSVAPARVHECNCRECQKHRRNWEKHMRKLSRKHHHDSRTCPECRHYNTRAHR